MTITSETKWLKTKRTETSRVKTDFDKQPSETWRSSTEAADIKPERDKVPETIKPERTTKKEPEIDPKNTISGKDLAAVPEVKPEVLKQSHDPIQVFLAKNSTPTHPSEKDSDPGGHIEPTTHEVNQEHEPGSPQEEHDTFFQ